ncbi:eukaryotic translation initiation factor 2 subunit 2-like isoform X2 [Varroa jacobsoni]|uniref:Eukaryotic translation initiation factor 2 subunit 2 n=1 Tax=Varroa destructor TaxID=109461 RepID=A0A7M7KWB7_VARDE|nr:eukaryotic translation initiation factor 2 subunit 2-like isoform X2 [Varroa destructor]XP_022696113.1 eukaryotic translation initiation factor 2 subunit 2-like isoform X2 [Varroa jacobsoni]
MAETEETGFDPTMKKKKKKKPFDATGFEGITDDVSAPAGDDEVEKASPKDGGKEDEDDNLDFTKMLKKKKKKTTFNFDDGTGTPVGDIDGGKASPNESGGKAKEDEDLDNVDFMKMMKKKKKKQAFNLDELGDALEDGGVDNADDDLDFNNMKKKKKKKKLNLDEPTEEDFDADEGSADTPSAAGAGGGSDAWRGTDRDYTYDELLQRVFNIMKERNPDMVAGEKKKFVMKPPQVLRVGTKKTSFANFLEITRTLRRAPKHLQAFLLAELGTSGSVDANNQLIIKGRFQQKQIENILRRYIKEYVTCHTCRAPETILEKDTRLNFLRCEKCGSRCSVQSIKSGFQAVTAKRAAIRAKAT